MALCATFAQTLQVLDSYLRFCRQTTALQVFEAWHPRGADLN
jgi:hypothetical protein